MASYPDYLIAARKAADTAAEAANAAVEAINAAKTVDAKAIAKIDWDLADDAKTEAYRAYMAAAALLLSPFRSSRWHACGR